MFLNNEEYYQADICLANYTDEFTRCGNQVMQDNYGNQRNSQDQDNGTEQEKNKTEVEKESSSVLASARSGIP